MDELLTALSVTGFKAKFENNTMSIVYDEISKPYLEKVLLDFSNIKGYQFRLATSNGHGEFLFGLNNKEEDVKDFARNLKGALATFDASVNYQERLSDQEKEIYDLFQNALKFDGKFGFGIQNLEVVKKIVIKTDIPELEESLRNAGFAMEDGKIRLVTKKDEDFAIRLHEANVEIENKLEKQEEVNTEEPEEIKPGESELDVYEKYVKDANGEDVIVRMSVVKQNKEDSEYERLVNISYLSPDGLVTSKEVLGYEDGHNFDDNALPTIIEGFHKDITSSGRKVEVSEVNPGKCYITGGDNQNSIYLDGYDVDYVQSIVAKDKEHNLVGDVDDTLDLSELAQNNVVEEAEMLGEQTFEEEVIGQDLDDNVPEEQYDDSENEYSNKEQVKTNDGKKMIRTLGTHPAYNGNSSSGLVNYLGLIFFFAVDILAIVLGIYLLTR